MPNEDGTPTPTEQLSSALNGENPSPVEEVSPTIEEVPQPVENAGHPAWQEILNSIPESLHASVLPTLKKWDDGVTDKLAKVHSTYDRFKTFVEGGVDPQELVAGRNMYQALNADPKKFFKDLAEYLKIDLGQGQEQKSKTEDLGDFTEDDDPRLTKLVEQQKLISEKLAEQEATKQAQEAEVWATSVMQRAKVSYDEKKFAVPFDDEYVISRASVAIGNGVDPDKAFAEAVGAWETKAAGFAAVAPVAPKAPPVVMPTGGATPKSTFEPGKLSGQDRRNLAAEMLRTALGGEN